MGWNRSSIPPAPRLVRLKDTAVTALLRGLSVNNSGLCLVISRERVADLAQFRQSTAPEWKLEHLSNVAGVALLENLGVKGPANEISRLVTDVQGHALTLFLLGKFLHEAYRGDISQRKGVRLEEVDREEGGHAFRVMDAYVKWFESEGEKGLRPLAVLRLLGLFDRPADAGSLSALRSPCDPQSHRTVDQPNRDAMERDRDAARRVRSGYDGWGEQPGPRCTPLDPRMLRRAHPPRKR